MMQMRSLRIRSARTGNARLSTKVRAAPTPPPEAKASADEAVFVQPSVNDDAQVSRKGDVVDAMDGTTLYGAPLGDTNPFANLGAVFSMRGAEAINGRMAQMGIVYALWREVLNNESVFQQCYNVREVAVRTLWLPKQGLFDALAVFVLVFAGSVAPALRGAKPNGLTEPGEKTLFFRPEAELLNSRAAMVGIAALIGIENVLGHGLLQW